MENNEVIEAFGLKTRVWTLHPVYGYGCSECCNRDRCEDDGCDAKYTRGKNGNCPHCKAKGWIKPEEVNKTTNLK